LEVAGIDRDYVAPEFSVTGLPIVERDDNGDPTGVVKEMDTLLPFLAAIVQPSRAHSRKVCSITSPGSA
jgi:hypothetical protein